MKQTIVKQTPENLIITDQALLKNQLTAIYYVQQVRLFPEDNKPIITASEHALHFLNGQETRKMLELYANHCNYDSNKKKQFVDNFYELFTERIDKGATFILDGHHRAFAYAVNQKETPSIILNSDNDFKELLEDYNLGLFPDNFYVINSLRQLASSLVAQILLRVGDEFTSSDYHNARITLEQEIMDLKKRVSPSFGNSDDPVIQSLERYNGFNC